MVNEYVVEYHNCAGWFNDSTHTSLARAKRRAKELGRNYGSMWNITPVRIRMRKVSKWKTINWKIK